jgi:hypothetical protein
MTARVYMHLGDQQMRETIGMIEATSAKPNLTRRKQANPKTTRARA